MEKEEAEKKRKRIEEEKLQEAQKLALMLNDLKNKGYNLEKKDSKTDSSGSSTGAASSSSGSNVAKRGGGRPKGSLGGKARALDDVSDAKVDAVLDACVVTQPVKWYPPILYYPILSFPFLLLSYPFLSYPML